MGDITKAIVAMTMLHYAKRLIWDGMVQLPSVKGEIALITGGSGALGQCLAEELLKEGATVVLWDLNEKLLLEAKEKLSKFSNNIHIFVCDITNRTKVYEVADRVKKEIGNVSILLNNAGVMSGKTILEQSDEVVERTIQVNSLALFWTTKAFLPHMIKEKKGYIVNVASTAGVFCANGLVDYCASKAAAIAFSRTLRLELHQLNKLDEMIHVTCICPYAIKTPLVTGWQHPPGLRSLKPNQVAKDIIWHMKMNDEMVFLPASMLFSFYYSILFPGVYRKLGDLVGVNKMTAKFEGRGVDFILNKQNAKL